MQASTLTTYFRMEGDQIGRAMQGKARQGRAGKRATVHGEEIVRLRWSVGPWAALGEDAVGTGVRTGEATSTGVLRHGGTRVRGGIRREGAKRNGAMNRGRGGRATTVPLRAAQHR